MNKLNLLLLFLFFLGVSCQQKKQTIQEFGKSVYQTYKTDLNDQKNLYLTKSELRKLLKEFRSDNSGNDQLNEFIDFTIEKQEEHINLAEYDLEITFSEFQWNNSKIDSITYDIVFPKPGKDSIINWPKSKTQIITDLKEKFLLDIFVFGNDNERKIRMDLNGVVFIDEELKLFKKRPSIKYVNE
ncbi:hypothetical protein [Psychroserpens ponticola]|uniref:Lipoprotein n=1 Tax=Psychroserpens ponticola TaxID=2932268 RepID=A0ABY7S514_9FLAO|nr:hypothetical protein [Psychroserpens ponticola]WCO03496.1 hypothetical protein MUN68_008300 [Psychroserpens ponticola]